MVNVGDKVFVAPLYGQKDNMAVITGPAGVAGPGIAEGDYNTWTKKWLDKPPDGICYYYQMDALIDEENGKLSISYRDNTNYVYLFGIYNLSDFSAVYESPTGSSYTSKYSSTTSKTGLNLGLAKFDGGGISQSIETYLLLLRADNYTIEVWQGGSSAVWSRNTRTDFGADCYCYVGGISLTGKYILAVIYEIASPYDVYLMLYEGSKV